MQQGETIHTYRQPKTESLKMFIVMIPVIVFLVVLFIFLKFAHSNSQLAVSTSNTNYVLGTHK
jgi:hypothetical protein